MVSNLKIQNDLISKTKDELEAKVDEFEQKNCIKPLQNLLQKFHGQFHKDHQRELDDLRKENDLIYKRFEKKNGDCSKTNFVKPFFC
ncbi:hypothetical protein GQ457_05G024280 [Hibiscus cannabinus]